jgi:hypothetical protein
MVRFDRREVPGEQLEGFDEGGVVELEDLR